MDYKKIIKSDYFIFLLLLLIFYGMFRYSESFNKGFNLIEDQALINTSQIVENNSFITSFDKMTKTEIDSLRRFRPFYLLYLMSTVYFFGVNLLLINIYVTIICIVTAFFLYKFCMLIGFKTYQAILLSLLTTIGPPTIMWIRPVDSEIIAMLLFSLSLYFMAKSIFSDDHNFIYKLSFLVLLVFVSLSKESFLLTIPAVLFIYIWLYSKKNNLSFISSIKANYFIINSNIVIFIGVLLCIISFVGTDPSQSYSGVDVNLLSLKVYLDFLITALNSKMFILILAGILIVLINAFVSNKKSPGILKNKIITVLPIMIFMIFLIMPQLILYYKTGFIGGRYYLPYLFGFSFTLIYLLKLIFDNISINTVVRYTYLIAVIIILFIEAFTVAIPELTLFSKKCKLDNELINTVAKNPNNELLIVLEPVQNFYSLYPIKVFLKYLNSEKQYSYDYGKLSFVNKIYLDTSYYNHTQKISDKSLSDKRIDTLTGKPNAGSILVFNGLNKDFLVRNKTWFNPNNYESKQFFSYMLYTKK